MPRKNSPSSSTTNHDLLVLQAQVATEISTCREPQVVLENVLELVTGIPAIGGIWIWFHESETDEFHLRNFRGLAEETLQHLAKGEPGTPVVNHLLVGNEVIRDWELAWGEKAEVFKKQGFSQVGMLPLFGQGQTVGAMGVLAEEEEGFTDGVALFLRTVATQLSGLISQARLEADLRNSKFNLDQLVSTFKDYIFIALPSGEILYCNSGHFDLDGPGIHQAHNRKIEDLIPGYPSHRTISHVAEGVDLTKPYTCNLVISEAEVVPVEVRSFMGKWDGKPVRYYICRDISRTINLERERTLLTTAIEQSEDSIIITDSSGTIKYVNQAFSRVSGYPKEEALGANPRVLKSGMHKDDFYKEMWTSLSGGQVWSGTITNRRKDGEKLIEDATISPIRDHNGIITHYVALKKDVTRELELEERLLHSQKMEAIGTLAGGLAHDFNNILYALMGYCQLAMDDVAEDHPAQISLEEILKAGHRASTLVAKMLTLGCRDKGEMVDLDLVPIVQEALDLVRASLPTTILFDISLESGKASVKADPTQIHQVVLNLCTNAEHALRKGRGTLKIHLKPMQVSGKESDQNWDLAPGQYLCLEIGDTGRGMDKETVSRIFEPYFTTKDANEGTGLGLATVQGIILNHNGQIHVESALDQGTTFTMFFPVSQPMTGKTTIQPAPIVSEVEQKPDYSGRILVLDDDKMIVDVQTKALTRLGYSVDGFLNGNDALAAIEKEPEAFDLIITDQIMPLLTGFEFAEKVLSICPEIPIIMTTGYSEELSEGEIQAAGITTILAKPLKIATLAKVVVGILARGRTQIEV